MFHAVSGTSPIEYEVPIRQDKLSSSQEVSFIDGEVSSGKVSSRQEELSTMQEAAAVAECPLHVAMGELAHVSVTQHILYLEGECLPRPELLAELDRWVAIHTLIHDRVCVASRATPLEDSEFESASQIMLQDAGGPGTCGERLVTACAACNRSRSCPLGTRTRSGQLS